MNKSSILVIIGEQVTEFLSLRDLLDFVILAMRNQTVAKATTTATPTPVAEVQPLSTSTIAPKVSNRTDKVIDKIIEAAKADQAVRLSELQREDTPKAQSTTAPTGQGGLPPMKRAYFGGQNKESLLSFKYEINGEQPKSKPADISRILFTKTLAFAQMPQREKDKVVSWGLFFLKKLVRPSSGGDGKPHSIETTMAEQVAIDRFNFLKGASIRFTVSLKDPL